MISPNIQRDLNRWYKLKPIPEQIDLINSSTRYNIVSAGRRSGKTERAKRKLIKAALRDPGKYFIVAPTIPQVRLIYWDDIKRLGLGSLQSKKPLEAQLLLPFDNGSTIHLLGMENPKRFEGVAWKGGIVDEVAYIKEDAIMLSILPALDTADPENPGYKPWCWFIGKPNGLNHFYRLFQYAKTASDPEWSAHFWMSSALLDQETLDAAKRRMSASQYKQEYEASFETATGRIYPDYNEKNHTNAGIDPEEPIYYFCDFNYTPMSHGIGVRRGEDMFLLDEIILTSAVSSQNMLEFTERYKNHKNKTLYLYGDASGKAGEKHGQMSSYTQMEEVLRLAGWKFQRRVKAANPSIVDRQNALRAKICNALNWRSVFVNPNTAPWINEAFLTVQLKEGSAFQEDDSNKYQHILTAVGYMVDYEWPVGSDYNSPLDIQMSYY